MVEMRRGRIAFIQARASARGGLRSRIGAVLSYKFTVDGEWIFGRQTDKVEWCCKGGAHVWPGLALSGYVMRANTISSSRYCRAGLEASALAFQTSYRKGVKRPGSFELG